MPELIKVSAYAGSGELVWQDWIRSCEWGRWLGALPAGMIATWI